MCRTVPDYCSVFLTRVLDSRYHNQSHLFTKMIKNTPSLHLVVNFTINYNRMVTNYVPRLFISTDNLNFLGKISHPKSFAVNISQNILCENENGNN